MPLYEYQCSECNAIFEELSKPDVTAPECPRCGAQSQRRIAMPAKGNMSRTPDSAGHGCCGEHPANKGCTPGSCCDKR
ncbi:FmdB family zinc ribbon protein [Desulfovibrio oxyclinae]|uniref:FmdB family zinc ribbon protein n=1 Tax=Desulfovibrio oxyclinae TaxID=63560 RepID=UPI0009FC1D50